MNTDLEQIAQSTSRNKPPMRHFSNELMAFGALGALVSGYALGISREHPTPQPQPTQIIEQYPQARAVMQADLNNDGKLDIAFIQPVYENNGETDRQEVVIMLSKPHSERGRFAKVIRKQIPEIYQGIDSIEFTPDTFRPDIVLTDKVARENAASEEPRGSTYVIRNDEFNKY